MHLNYLNLCLLNLSVRAIVQKQPRFKSLGSYLDVVILSAPEVGVVPDLLPFETAMNFTTTCNFRVQFNQEGKTYGLNSANRMLFDARLAENEPSLDWNAEKGKTYSIVFLDLDAPKGRGDEENPKYKQFLMWLKNGVTNTTTTDRPPSVSYLSPRPAQESTAPHRFVFVLNEETAKTPPNPAGLPQGMSEQGEIFTDRANFNYTTYQEKNFLHPVAIEYFISNPIPIEE